MTRHLGLALILLSFPLAAAADSAQSSTDLNNLAVQKAKQGNFPEAIAALEQSLALAPADAIVRKNLSLMLTDYGIRLQKEGDAQKATALFLKAVEHFPENGLALAHLGNLYYLDRNDFSAALAYWRRAYPLVPPSEREPLANRMQQAERDRAVERNFLTRTTPHFQIRYADASGGPAAARAGDLLEQRYKNLAGELGTNPGVITAIVYSRGDFQRLSNRPDWAVGFYDGRIRVRLEDVDAGREVWILPHELAHAFLHKIYGTRLPIWIHEGYAQAQEPARQISAREEALAGAVRDRTGWVPLQWLDGRFTQPGNQDDVDRAYAQAKAAVGHLLEKNGMPKFKAFLEKISKGKPIEQSFDEVFAPMRFSRFSQGSWE
ncbi:MAG: hypothetical protein HY594_02410 [Candidatus Omnitrophica bacterium]|nr:hypothetical protein [Candidatus Omnitrophota bacterium]